MTFLWPYHDIMADLINDLIDFVNDLTNDLTNDPRRRAFSTPGTLLSTERRPSADAENVR